jgi:glycosyltransferase involved in cell wall biosynthesis
MYWPPNAEGMIWFIDEILPLLRQRSGSVALDIVGKRPPAGLRQRAARDPAVCLAGYVADLGPIMACAAVFIVPLLAGSGMRVKILTAMAYGVPVVSTTYGAEGIDAVDGQDLLLADTPAGFATAVVGLLADPARAARIGTAGRRLVTRRYDFRQLLAPLEALLAPEMTP